MKKRICVSAVLLALALLLTGCGRWGIFSNEIDEAIWEMMHIPEDFPPDLGETPDDGYTYTGGLGDVMESCFFSFMVEAPELQESYGGYTAEPGWQLLKTRITVNNTYGEELPMSIYDFQVQWGSGEYDYGYEADAFLQMEGCMPEYYALEADETAAYDVVYEVPADSTAFSICYIEYFSDGTTGDLFFVDFYAGETAGGGSHQTGTML